MHVLVVFSNGRGFLFMSFQVRDHVNCVGFYSLFLPFYIFPVVISNFDWIMT